MQQPAIAQLPGMQKLQQQVLDLHCDQAGLKRQLEAGDMRLATLLHQISASVGQTIIRNPHDTSGPPSFGFGVARQQAEVRAPAASSSPRAGICSDNVTLDTIVRLGLRKTAVTCRKCGAAIRCGDLVRWPCCCGAHVTSTNHCSCTDVPWISHENICFSDLRASPNGDESPEQRSDDGHNMQLLISAAASASAGLSSPSPSPPAERQSTPMSQTQSERPVQFQPQRARPQIDPQRQHSQQQQQMEDRQQQQQEQEHQQQEVEDRQQQLQEQQQMQQPLPPAIVGQIEQHIEQQHIEQQQWRQQQELRQREQLEQHQQQWRLQQQMALAAVPSAISPAEYASMSVVPRQPIKFRRKRAPETKPRVFKTCKHDRANHKLVHPECHAMGGHKHI